MLFEVDDQTGEPPPPELKLVAVTIDHWTRGKLRVYVPEADIQRLTNIVSCPVRLNRTYVPTPETQDPGRAPSVHIP